MHDCLISVFRLILISARKVSLRRTIIFRIEKHLRSFFVRQTTERQREILLAVFLSRSSLFDQNSVPFLRLLAPTDRQSLRRRLKIPNCLSSGVVTPRFTELKKKLALRKLYGIEASSQLYRFEREIPAVHRPILSNIGNRSENRANKSFELPLARDTRIYFD